MRSIFRLSALGAFLLVCLAGPASAQIMRITTDNPSDNTVLKHSGTTLLTITLDPNFDSNYGQVWCNWATCIGPAGRLCGIISVPECNQNQFPHLVTGYDIILIAVGGSVTWGTFTPADAAYVGSQTATDTQVEINYSRLLYNDNRPFTIGTIPVTPASPKTTHLEIVRNSPSRLGTVLSLYNCGGFFGPVYVLGDPANPCVTPFAPADWFDAQGVVSPMDACLAKTNHGQCEVCCKEELGGAANTCAKFCNQIKGGAGEPLP